MKELAPFQESFCNLSSLTVVILIASAIIASSNVVSAVASGATWEASYDMNLDKAEYKPGDTVTIHVRNTFYWDQSPVVTIRRVASSDDSSTLNNYQNLDVVYKRQSHLINGTTEFKYVIPVGSNNLFAEDTRYLVILTEPMNGSPDTPVKTLFFMVKGEGSTPFPLIIGIGVAIAVAAAFLTLRKHSHKSRV